MRLWTIQPLKWYEQLLEKGSISGDKTFVQPNFLQSYYWLMEKMDERIGTRPFSDCFPVWAWYQYENAQKRKPDLRYTSLLAKGTKGVRIEIRKNEEDVLLSDFDLWHHAINKWYLGKNKVESVAFENELKHLNAQGFDTFNFNTLPADIQYKIIKSWDVIFNLEFNDPYYTHPKDKKSIQATFWTLSVKEISKVEMFVAK